MVKNPTSLDELIRKAMEDGVFDNLPGKGKPLSLNDNPYEDPTWRLANRVLCSSGYSLPWIDTRKAILAEADNVRNRLSRSLAWRKTALEQNPADDAVVIEWPAPW